MVIRNSVRCIAISFDNEFRQLYGDVIRQEFCELYCDVYRETFRELYGVTSFCREFLDLYGDVIVTSVQFMSRLVL